MAERTTPQAADNVPPGGAPQDGGRGRSGGLLPSEGQPPASGRGLSADGGGSLAPGGGQSSAQGDVSTREKAPALRFSHLTEAGEAHMVDVTAKSITAREATAIASVHCSEHVMRALREGKVPKGDVLAVARLAGIQAAKRVPELLPLAHPIEIHGAEVELQLRADRVEITATVRTAGRTGVEMEALTAANVAALAVIDMVKGVDRSAEIIDCKIIYKSGGRSGTWYRPGYEPGGGAGGVALVGVIVLAGGTGIRLGGVSKPDVVVGGKRLLDLALAEVRRACDRAAGGAQHDSAGVPAPEIVVVAPDGVALPPDVHRTLEDPPLGGPVAGLAAGLAELNKHLRKSSPQDYPVHASGGGSSAAMPTSPDSTTHDAPEKPRWAAGTPRRAAVALLTCDAPLAPRLYPELLGQLAAHPQAAGAVPLSQERGGEPVAGEVAQARGRVFRQYLNGVYDLGALSDTLRGELRGRPARAVFAELPVIEVPDSDNVCADVDTWDDAADLEHRLAGG